MFPVQTLPLGSLLRGSMGLIQRIWETLQSMGKVSHCCFYVLFCFALFFYLLGILLEQIEGTAT